MAKPLTAAKVKINIMKNENTETKPSGKPSDASTCSPEFVLEFGKHKGKSLERIAEEDNAYILWLDREDVLVIDREFLKSCQMDDYLDDGERWSAFRND